MAILIKNKAKNTVQKNYHKYRAMWGIKWLLRAGSTVAAAWAIVSCLQNRWIAAGISAGIAVVAGVLSLLLQKKTYHGMRILRSGYLGEKRTTAFLKNLSDDFVVLPDILLARDIQIDQLVLCPAGIVILEVKNHRGVVHLKNRKAPMMHSKRTKAGIVYENQAENPIQQAMRLESAVRAMRKDWGYARLPIKGAIYFSNPHAVIENKAAYPVFSYQKRSKLLKFLGELLTEDVRLTQKEMMRLAGKIRRADGRTERPGAHNEPPDKEEPRRSAIESPRRSDGQGYRRGK